MDAIEGSSLIEWILAATIVGGGFFTLVGSIGLVRLDDVFQRMHAPTKATTLGVGLILLSSSIYAWLSEGNLSVHQILVAALLFVSAPVSAHLVARVALHQGLGDRTGLRERPARAAVAPASENPGSRPGAASEQAPR